MKFSSVTNKIRNDGNYNDEGYLSGNHYQSTPATLFAISDQ